MYILLGCEKEPTYRSRCVSKASHLGSLLNDFCGEQADAPLALYPPLLGFCVGATAMVNESQDAPLLAGVDDLPPSQIHHEFVFVVGVE